MLECPLAQRPGDGEGAALHGRLAGGEKELVRAHGNGRVVFAVGKGLDVVIGGELGRLDAAVRRHLLDPFRNATVQIAALAARQRRVRDLACQRVLERELGHPGHGR